MMVPTAAILLATWITLAPTQTARQEVAAVAANGKVYVIGGFAADISTLSSVEEYDPVTNLWRFVAPLPRPRHHPAAVTLGNSIYVIGGYESVAFAPVSTVYRYNIAANQWTTVAPLPTPRGALAAAVIDGKIYAAGGAPGNGRGLLVYDPATNMWTALEPMPTGREHVAAVAVDGLLYVIGGRLAGNTNAFERYDPATNTWTVLPPMPSSRGALAATEIAGRIWTFGGEGNPARADGMFLNVESFDITSETWRIEPPMAVPRHGAGAALIGTRIHIPAGAEVEGFAPIAHHDALELAAGSRRGVRH